MNQILTVADLIGILEKQNPESPVRVFDYLTETSDFIGEVYYDGEAVVIA